MSGKNNISIIMQAKKWLFLYIWCRYLYRPVMRFTHRFNWHYAPPMYTAGEGGIHLHCQWCGFRQTIKYSDDMKIVTPNGDL